jgi:hypothetical protein
MRIGLEGVEKRICYLQTHPFQRHGRGAVHMTRVKLIVTECGLAVA